MRLGETLQLVLQTEGPNGEYLCEGFSGIPAIHPSYIVLTTDGTSESYQNATRLRDLIHTELRVIEPSISSTEVPCGGQIDNPSACHAHNTTHCKRLLVLIGSGNSPLPPSNRFDDWKDDSYLTLPVIPDKNRNSLSHNLRRAFSASNAVFYENNVGETIPAIFSSVGLTYEEQRIFISYRRQDSSELAEQLFDSLTHEGFDVFLDRFRVPPAVNFQRRLTHELADKSMVIVLESQTFNESEWTRYEIDFAIKHRLGLFAVQTIGGKDLEGIEEEFRLRLTTADYDHANPKILNDLALSRVVGTIKLEHGRKLVWRRKILWQSMVDALSLEGLEKEDIDLSDIIRIKPNLSTPIYNEYVICLTPRPPVLRNFYETHEQASYNPSTCGLVVGPVSSQEPFHQKCLYWLGDVSSILCFDEGQMTDVAKAIKGGII